MVLSWAGPEGEVVGEPGDRSGRRLELLELRGPCSLTGRATFEGGVPAEGGEARIAAGFG